MSKLTDEQLMEIFIKVDEDKRNSPHLRVGQSFFNNLVQMYPEFEWVRNSEFDCFYQNGILLKLLKEITN